MSARMARAARGLALTVTSLALAASIMAPAMADEHRREVYAGPASGDSVASPSPVRETVTDKARDARGTGYLHRYADLRQVAYRTPSVREGGTMTVRARWRDLLPQVKGRKIRQGLSTFVDLRADRGKPFSYGSYGPLPQFSLYVITDEGTELVRPKDVRIQQQPGRSRTVVTLSTEWLEPGRVSIFSLSNAEGRDFDRAYDDTRGARLRVGPAPAAD